MNRSRVVYYPLRNWADHFKMTSLDKLHLRTQTAFSWGVFRPALEWCGEVHRTLPIGIALNIQAMIGFMQFYLEC